jgi:hypothetical protein
MASQFSFKILKTIIKAYENGYLRGVPILGDA